jgi:4-diphosphocytidyl-2-C-methyl-D-erythritol kinase
LMSGSGSTVFAVLKDKAAGSSLAKRAREEVDQKIWNCSCETI